MSTNAPVMNIPYTVTVDGNNYVVRVDRNLLEREELNRLLDYFLFQPIVQRSAATQPEIDALATEVDRSAWERIKAKLTVRE